MVFNYFIGSRVDHFYPTAIGIEDVFLPKGRFDELFFVDLPEAPDRKEIIGLYFRKYLGAEPSQELLTDLVTLTDGFSGSDIDAVIHDIATKVYVDRMPPMPLKIRLQTQSE